MVEKKKSAKIRVQMIFRRQSIVVIERMVDGYPERVSVSEDCLSQIQDSEEFWILEEDFDMGIQYGIPFELKLSRKTLDPEFLAKVLHQSGIWTAQDIVKNPKIVQGAILSACRETFFELNALIREVKE